MSGETNLNTLIATMSATLQDGVFVFVTLGTQEPPTGIKPRMQFEEAEGTTLICLKSEAEAYGIAFEFPCRMITLDVHSALDAVGFMARIATELAKHNMGVNPVAGFYHDHLFVPADRAEDAMMALEAMSASLKSK